MGDMRSYRVQIEGKNPLLMHADDVSWADQMQAWRKDPRNKSVSKAGDDRSPAWTWIGSLYTDGKRAVLPADNLMSAIMEGAAMQPTGKRGGTFKSRSMAGIMVAEASWPLLVQKGGRWVEIPTKFLAKLAKEKDFEEHLKATEAAGFSLFVKRARVGQAKHIRVRPRFETWAAEGTLNVFDDEIKTDILESILSLSGQYKGLGDWRPGSPKKPGPFGTFTTTVTKIR